MHFTQKSNDFAESDVAKVEISLKAGSTSNLKTQQSTKVLHVVCMHVLCFAVNQLICVFFGVLVLKACGCLFVSRRGVNRDKSDDME